MSQTTRQKATPKQDGVTLRLFLLVRVRGMPWNSGTSSLTKSMFGSRDFFSFTSDRAHKIDNRTLSTPTQHHIMKLFYTLPLLLSTASAFTQYGNNAGKVPQAVSNSADERSASLPFLKRPALLDGSLPGDRGFDPLNFANSEKALEWQRRAEVKHGRIAMVSAHG